MSGLTLGDFTGDWDYGDLPPGVRLGEGVRIAQRQSFSGYYSARDPGLVLGDRVTVHEWTGFAIHEHGCLEVGEDSVLVGPGFWCSESIRVGARVVISYGVLITDSDMHPRDPDLRRQDAVALTWHGSASTARPTAVTPRPVVVEDDAWIGIGAIVMKGSRIGRGARVAPGAVVAGDVPDGAVVEGNPARPVEP